MPSLLCHWICCTYSFLIFSSVDAVAISYKVCLLSSQVTEAERKLRGLLLLDGFMTEGASDYLLARYNSPFELLRRNEILIRLKDIDIDH